MKTKTLRKIVSGGMNLNRREGIPISDREAKKSLQARRRAERQNKRRNR